MIQFANLSTNWAATNPIIPKGEFALETDTNKVKLGNGLTPWNSLAYFGEGSTITIDDNPTSGSTNAVSSGGVYTQLGLKSVKTTTDPLSPLINQTYTGEVNLSTNYEVYYNSYSTNVAETPTISATPLVGAVARLYFVTGASGALVATNLGTLRAGSDTYTVSKTNEILVFSLPEGLEYSIKVLN